MPPGARVSVGDGAGGACSGATARTYRLASGDHGFRVTIDGKVPGPDHGLDINANYGVVTAGYWWEVLFDALAIASLVVAVTLVSDSIEGVLER